VAFFFICRYISSNTSGGCSKRPHPVPNELTIQLIPDLTQALNDGAKIGDLYLYTTKTTPAEFGAAKVACQNCTFTFKGNVLDALTGWYKGD